MALNVKKFSKFVAEKVETGDITSLDIDYLDALLAIFLENLRKPNALVRRADNHIPTTKKGANWLIGGRSTVGR